MTNEALRRIVEYVQHKAECPALPANAETVLFIKKNGEPFTGCTCGLDDLLAALAAPPAEPQKPTHLSRWCAEGKDAESHCWCANRDADETRCKCGCHRLKPRTYHTVYAWLREVEAAASPAPAAPDPDVSERIARIQAHRACHAAEHDPLHGKIHGYCVVCGVPFPCDYVGAPGTRQEDR